MPEAPLAAYPHPERRQDLRIAADDAVRLVASSGQVFDATAVDRSLRGMRVRFASVVALPTELTVLVPSSGVAHPARLVWRSAPYAGLLLLRTVEMRAASGPDEADLRRLWREHVTRRSVGAG